MATNYDINYNDERFTNVKAEEKAALTESNKTYDSMISNSDKYYDKQIQASKDWADKQTEIQNQQTDFAIEQIEQQKAQAKSDYTKEQSGAYVDWQKQSNPYGAEAEQRASVGMTGTGYSESAQVSMYNTYQNRVATARESYNRAVLNYDNAIKDARLQNNAALAEIAYEALQKQLELSLAGFQYKNSLIIEKANKATELKNTYYARYQDVLKQINQENALAEEVRQYNESLAEEKRQYDASHALQQESLQLQKDQFAWQKAQAAKSSSSSSGSSIKKSSGSSKKSSGSSIATTSKIQAAKKAEVAKTLSGGSTKSSSSEPTIDMNSVLALGYGPISAAKLNQLVKEGKAVKYVEGNKIKFRPSVNGR